jgi:hypothetical protein
MRRFSRISLFAWKAVCNGGFAENWRLQAFWTIAQTIAHLRSFPLLTIGLTRRELRGLALGPRG